LRAVTTVPQTPAHRAPAQGGLSAGTITVLQILVASVAALVDAYLGYGVGWPFAIVLTLFAAYTTLRAHREDVFWGPIAVPIAYAAAILLVALLGPGSSGGLVERVAGVTFLLADEAMTMVAALLVSTVIALIRRFR
jgi:hypothetical protein